MKKLPFILSVLILAFACDSGPEFQDATRSELLLLNKFQDLPGYATLKLAEEKPGIPLYLCLTLVTGKDSLIIPRSEVIVYHADSSGVYNESIRGVESTAEISGKVRSDDLGRIYIETILPGDYPDRNDNRHIHLLIPGGNPEAYDIHFYQFTDFFGREFIRGSGQHFTIKLRNAPGGGFVGFRKISVQEYKRARAS